MSPTTSRAGARSRSRSASPTAARPPPAPPSPDRGPGRLSPGPSHQAAAQGLGDDLRPGAHAEEGEELLEPVLDRVRAQVHALADLLVGHALGDRADDREI